MGNSWSNTSITSLTIPTGATTGARIVIDGETGDIQIYDSNGELAGYLGPAAEIAGGSAPIILTFETGGGEWSGLWNGSCLVGLGDPTTDETQLQAAGGIKEIGNGGILLENTYTPSIPVEGTVWIKGGTLATGAPGTSGLPVMLLTSNASQGPLGPMDVIASSAIVKGTTADPSTAEVWHVIGASGGTAYASANFAAGSVASANYQQLQFRKDAFDNLVVEGTCHATAALAAGAYTLFTLPSTGGFRPKKIHPSTDLHVSSADAFKATIRVNVDSSGAVNFATTSAIAISDGFYISATVPLGNIP